MIDRQKYGLHQNDKAVFIISPYNRIRETII